MATEKILIIDDSPTIIKVVELVLSKAGFKIISARDGKEGIKLAKEEKPDLILLDFVMPKMNGYQVCKVISADLFAINSKYSDAVSEINTSNSLFRGISE